MVWNAMHRCPLAPASGSIQVAERRRRGQNFWVEITGVVSEELQENSLNRISSALSSLSLSPIN